MSTFLALCLLVGATVISVRSLAITNPPSLPYLTSSPFNRTLTLPSSLSTPHDPSFWYLDGDIIVTEYFSYREYLQMELYQQLRSAVENAYFEAKTKIDAGRRNEALGEAPYVWCSRGCVAYLRIDPKPRTTWLMVDEMTKQFFSFWQAKRYHGGMRFQLWLRHEVEQVGMGELYVRMRG